MLEIGLFTHKLRGDRKPPKSVCVCVVGYAENHNTPKNHYLKYVKDYFSNTSCSDDDKSCGLTPIPIPTPIRIPSPPDPVALTRGAV